MSKNKLIVFVIVALVVAVGLFYGGLKYGEAHSRSAAGSFVRGGGAGANFAGRPGAAGARAGANGGLVAGEIISNDGKSITVGLQGGGSKIVFLATSTPVTKSVSGNADDLKAGTNVMIVGTTNSDGSVTAESVQIRTATSAPR